MSRKIGDSSKIVSITPKLYIKDDGTNYTTGEQYNGLWSTNTADTDFSVVGADGYGNAGHWKFNEIEGNTAFNLRHRGVNNVLLGNMRRGRDGTGTFVQFSLSNNRPLPAASPEYYCMVGTGGGNTETTAFNNFIQSDAINDHPRLASGNLFNGKMFFDIWADFYPVQTGETQTIFYMHNNADSDNFDRVLKLDIKNDGGSMQVRFKFLNNAGTGLANFSSENAGTALYPNGAGNAGGLHHLALVFDREIVSANSLTYNNMGIYVDGIQQGINSSSGTIINSAVSVNTNAFIGCRISDNNGTWTATQGSGDPKFDEHFLGKIYMAQLSSDASGPTKSRIANLHGMRFEVPRGPEKVDFSDRFEVDGPNVLQDIGTLKQQMETLKGTFTVTLSSVKVKN